MSEHDDRCPCGTGETYGECCGRYLADGRRAPTAEALMRSRYTGFATGAAHYLLVTLAPEHPAGRPRAGRRRWSGTGWTWSARTPAGRGTTPAPSSSSRTTGSTTARVGQRGRLHETSRFVREDGRWLYVDGGIGS